MGQVGIDVVPSPGVVRDKVGCDIPFPFRRSIDDFDFD